ncbi:hypothetical protein KQX54_009952 [Cotesia glomerata]|uniref:Uncharacterized protein n=1 Tax=Cotesia glomerata TaxID=32391 RepID=A0AAV7IEH8_COTGL|nr:hypothetical protein KQX54_009952 [Cotesia glomerata]
MRDEVEHTQIDVIITITRRVESAQVFDWHECRIKTHGEDKEEKLEYKKRERNKSRRNKREDKRECPHAICIWRLLADAGIRDTSAGRAPILSSQAPMLTPHPESELHRIAICLFLELRHLSHTLLYYIPLFPDDEFCWLAFLFHSL